MIITLSSEQAEMVRRKVASGMFEDASGVVDEAFRLMEEQDKLERLKAAIAVGYAEYERGETSRLTPELLEEIRRDADRMTRENEEIDPDVWPA